MTMLLLVTELMYLITSANRLHKDKLLTKICVLTVATLILWIADSDIFFYTGFTALTLKAFEFLLRFVN